MTLKSLTAAAAVATLASGALADDTDTVQVFYDLLSDPGSTELAAAFEEVTAESWESISGYTGTPKTRDEFLGQMGGFAQLMPDLDWDVQAMHQAGNVITVRSRATATPVAPFLGVDGQGRSFDIMTIDIHELEDGVIARTYHIEDWATAMGQLAGQ